MMKSLLHTIRFHKLVSIVKSRTSAIAMENNGNDQTAVAVNQIRLHLTPPLIQTWTSRWKKLKKPRRQ
ncbi:hypothetical protein DdX_01725 [Ditylenchus destructor]|uniref:Uncharacterized protein n=1 Tax=Ditylenchus destructor TaxID=166010 RepID=A0AAD4RBE9_9BILA|nr:hypothetical protein DdX_01725 [Ditylenchus destructor]